MGFNLQYVVTHWSLVSLDALLPYGSHTYSSAAVVCVVVGCLRKPVGFATAFGGKCFISLTQGAQGQKGDPSARY
jgi:hypothetical protein